MGSFIFVARLMHVSKGGGEGGRGGGGLGRGGAVVPSLLSPESDVLGGVSASDNWWNVCGGAAGEGGAMG